MRAVRFLVAALVAAVISALAAPAFAQLDNLTGTNVEEGDNRATTRQGGAAGSGDSVGGQVSGVVSSGRASVDARNTSRDSSVESGDVEGTNSARSFTGLNAGNNTAGDVRNEQTGDNRSALVQTADASSGDAVGGQVLGSVVASGGSSSIVADNLSELVDVTTGDAESANNADTFVGLNAAATSTLTEFVSITQTELVNCMNVTTCLPDQTNLMQPDVSGEATADATNGQDGDNRGSANQSAPASSGDGVAGQVIGSVSAGATSIDARNRSVDSSVETGDADSTNGLDSFVGLDAQASASGAGTMTVTQANSVTCLTVGACTPEQDNLTRPELVVFAFAGADNEQEGDNRSTISQSASASSGDGVAGQVIGSVTAAGGSSSIVADNASERVDATSGDADSANSASSFVGLDADATADATNAFAFTESNILTCNIVTTCDTEQINFSNSITFNAGVSTFAGNDQEGDNSGRIGQSAPATTGDAVAGQVIGSVAAGASSVDARNRSVDSSVETGDADSANAASSSVGLDARGSISVTTDVDVSQANVMNCATVFLCTAEQSNGLNFGATDRVTEDVLNDQDGDNRASIGQSAPATSGDGVGGQVIGAVTSAGGASSIVGDNLSDRVDVRTGDSDSANAADSFVGLAADASATVEREVDVTQANSITCTIVTTCRPLQENAANITFNSGDVTLLADNGQVGDNRAAITQSAPASTGDGVGGQVIGAVSAGATSIDARNRSVDSTVETGDADTTNDAASFVGLEGDATVSVTNALSVDQLNTVACVLVTTCLPDQTNVVTSVLTTELNPAAVNDQDGDNRARLSQSAPASSGDGVAGQVVGAVTAAGGSASIVADNLSDRVDAKTGDADAANAAASFVGLDVGAAATLTSTDAFEQTLITTCAGAAFCGGVSLNQSTNFLEAAAAPAGTNVQEGDNRISGSQLAAASTGDAVAGQVRGAVSAGATSIDARNRSVDSVAESGDSDSSNDMAAFVGLNITADDPDVVVADLVGVTGDNVQEGDNRRSFRQSAEVVSGDAVAGQVAGVVTSAGGSASVVVDNLSEGIDAQSGESEFDNDDLVFVGLNLSSVTAIE